MNPYRPEEIPPFLGECLVCNSYREGYPFPVFAKDGSFITTRHLCLSCWHKSLSPEDHAEKSVSP